MLNVLLESKAPHTRRVGGTLASALVHGAIITGSSAPHGPARRTLIVQTSLYRSATQASTSSDRYEPPEPQIAQTASPRRDADADDARRAEHDRSPRSTRCPTTIAPADPSRPADHARTT